MEKDTSGRHPESHIKPLGLVERIGLLYYVAQAQFPPRYRIPILANRHFLNLVWDISRGKVASQAPSKLRYKVFPDYETRATGLENIPKNGSFIIASNHYSQGPLKGSWQTMAIADVVLEKMPNRNKRHFRFIMDSEKDSTGIFGETIRHEFQKRQSHTLHNIAATLDYLPLNKKRKVLELLHQRQEGQEIIGIFPTGKAEFTFKTPASKEAGNFFEIAGRYDIPVLHIGAWHDGRKKTFIINIGEATVYKENLNDPNSKHITAEKVMLNIASLLPPKMRGIYSS